MISSEAYSVLRVQQCGMAHLRIGMIFRVRHNGVVRTFNVENCIASSTRFHQFYVIEEWPNHSTHQNDFPLHWRGKDEVIRSKYRNFWKWIRSAWWGRWAMLRRMEEQLESEGMDMNSVTNRMEEIMQRNWGLFTFPPCVPDAFHYSTNPLLTWCGEVKACSTLGHGSFFVANSPVLIFP